MINVINMRTAILAIALCVLLPWQTCAFSKETGRSSSVPAKAPGKEQNRWLLFAIKNDTRILGYVFGSSHVPLAGFTLPKKVVSAIKSADSIVFETNAGFDKNMQNQAAELLRSNPGGRLLNQVLLPETYKILNELVITSKFPKNDLPQLERWSPYLAVVSLGSACVTTKSDGVAPDSALYEFATRSAVPISQGLETVEEQIGWIHRLSPEEWHKFVSAHANWITSGHCALDLSLNQLALMREHEKGDPDAFEREYADFYRVAVPLEWLQTKYIITPRNILLSDRIASRLNSSGVVFFAVGAAHLGGRNGILRLLESKNYKIVQM